MSIKVHIDTSVCKGCALCLHYCPRGVFSLAGQHNEKGYVVAEAARPEDCVGCRVCEISCPDLAIFIEKDGVAEKA